MLTEKKLSQQIIGIEKEIETQKKKDRKHSDKHDAIFLNNNRNIKKLEIKKEAKLMLLKEIKRNETAQDENKHKAHYTDGIIALKGIIELAENKVEMNDVDECDINYAIAYFKSSISMTIGIVDQLNNLLEIKLNEVA
jgi:hypothetical protein